MSVPITLSAFQALTNSKGEFKTWGDLKDGGYVGTLINTQVLSNTLRAPVSITGENVWFEHTTLPLAKTFDKNGVAPRPVLDRVMFNLPEQREQHNYTLDLFGTKEAVEWSKYITVQDSNIFKQIQNYNNTLAVEAIKNYCIATGQFKVLPNLGVPGKTKDNYFEDTRNIATNATAIMSTQTSVNLGIEASRIKILTSPTAMLNITTGLAGTNVSQGAFNAIKEGEIKNLFGFNFDRNIYLGGKPNAHSEVSKQYDFSNIVAMVYTLEGLAFYQQTPLCTNTPINQAEVVRAWGWKPCAFMLPSREHTATIFVKTMPTEAEVNAARAKLLQEQPSAYKVLPGGVANKITTAEYNAMKTAANDYSVANLPSVEQKTTVK